MKILHNDEDIMIGISYDNKLDIFLLHAEVYKWSLSKYKKYLFIVGEILTGLAKENIKEVYSFVLDDKKQKFNELFGFIPCGKGVAEDNSNFTIMRLVGV